MRIAKREQNESEMAEQRKCNQRCERQTNLDNMRPYSSVAVEAHRNLAS